MTPEQIAAFVAAALDKALATSTLGGNSTTTSSDRIKLTPVAAKQLLESIMTDIQFTGKLSNKDINDFVAQYNKIANEQLQTVVQTVRTQTKPGDTAETVKNIINTNFPNFFQPKEFAQDYLWTKVNFGDETNLGAKALDALTEARSVAKDFNLSTVSDIEIRAAAKRIASGKIKKEDYITELAARAAAEYPQYTDRLKNTPGSTVRSLNNPVLRAVADEWEVDVNTLDLNDSFIDSLLRPDGIIGKATPATVGEARQKASMHPNADKTQKNITNATNAASQLAKAIGFS